MVLVLNDVTSRTEEYYFYKSLKKKFEKYNYLTMAENMLELDGFEEKEKKPEPQTKKFKYFQRKSKGSE